MNIFEIILLNVIFISFPLILYSFYLVNNKNIGKRENCLFLDFALISSFYLVIKFGTSNLYTFPLIIFNTILVVAYYKDRKLSCFFVTSLIIIYYYIIFKFSIMYLILEYLLYGLIYYATKKSDFNIFMFLFSVIKCIFLLYFLSNMNINFIDKKLVIEVFLLGLMLLLTSYFVIFLLDKSEDILRYHMAVKDLEQEKQIRMSLFKITHEIKNPIAVCKGYLDMFNVNNIEHSKRYVPILKEEIERVLLLLEDFLAMRQLNLNLDVIDINLLLDDVIKKFELSFTEKNIESVIQISDDELYIEGDYNRLIQLFVNVIKNAMEAMEDRDFKLLKISEVIYDNNIKIVIEDNGIGMSSEVYKKFMEPFYTTKNKGTGLGVSLSIDIVKSHNGTIEYETEEYVGTKVIITFPIYKIKE